MGRVFSSNDNFNGSPSKVSEFSGNNNIAVAVNGSTFSTSSLRGINIHNGVRYNGETSTLGRTYLTIDYDNHLYYTDNPLKENNIVESLVGFFPIIINGKNTISQFDSAYPHKNNANPQQLVFECFNGDKGFLSCNGRITGEKGLTVEECCDILLNEKNVKFAYLLDGGGSVTTTMKGCIINIPSDNTGERPVKDFLYFR